MTKQSKNPHNNENIKTEPKDMDITEQDVETFELPNIEIQEQDNVEIKENIYFKTNNSISLKLKEKYHTKLPHLLIFSE